MIVLIIGLSLVIIGALSIRFPELVESLKANEHRQWELLGSPPAYAFSKTIGVYSWVLRHGYEKLDNDEIKNLGNKALHKALFAKYSLLIGISLMCLGFIYALFGG